MGLLVSFNGQFRAYSPPTIEELNRKRVHKTNSTGEVFEKALDQATEQESNNTSYLPIKAYQKLQKKEYTKSAKVFLVRDLMSSPVHFISKDEKPAEVQYKIDKYQHHVYPVLDEDKKLVGMIRTKNLTARPVSEVLETEYMVVYEDCPLRSLVTTMMAESIYHFPVIDHQRHLVGIITQTDIFKFLLEKLPIEKF